MFDNCFGVCFCFTCSAKAATRFWCCITQFALSHRGVSRFLDANVLVGISFSESIYFKMSLCTVVLNFFFFTALGGEKSHTFF